MTNYRDALSNMEGILNLAADSKTKLRSSDVDRVMQQAYDNEIAEEFRAFLLASPSFSDPNTRAAIHGWTPDGGVPDKASAIKRLPMWIF